ncbi:MAG: histone deacetylase [bacterium]|nr:histone deacetylase [bacterium]
MNKILGLGSSGPGPYFVIHKRYQPDTTFPQYDPRRPFRILSYLETRNLLRQGTLRRPRPATIRQLQRVHDQNYLNSLGKDGALEPILGFPLNNKAQDKFLCFQRMMCGGTIRAARLATKWQEVAINLGGGFHHASSNHGSGFCVFNDVAVAIAALREQGFDDHILIIDLDLHDGDGTRSIFSNDKTVHTFSIHNKTLGSGDALESTSIELGSGVSDSQYIEALKEHLPPLLPRFKPKLVFFLAGSDPSNRDQLGDWNISMEGMLTRDRLVMGWVRPGEPALDIPLVILLAGGYGNHAWRHGAAFFHWLLGGSNNVDIPLELELPVGHYRRLTRLMKTPVMMHDEKPTKTKPDPDDWGLQESELGMPGQQKETRFLGTFSRLAVELALVEYGLMDRLHRLGFKELRMALDLDDPLGHTIRVQTGGVVPLVVLELKVKIDRPRKTTEAFLSVEWLLIQDTRSRFEMSRPLLPGQKHPGLGLLRHTAAVLVVLCERLNLDGLSFTPTHYHLAALSRPLAFCPDPNLEGKFRALKNTLSSLDIRSAGIAVENGRVWDVMENQKYVWKPAKLIIPVSRKLKDKYGSANFLRDISAMQSRAAFRFEPDSPS